MISLYSGTPGSGKSLHIATRLYWWIRSGKPAICNFPINLEAISRKHVNRFNFICLSNSDLTPEYLIRFARERFAGKTIKEDSILLVIDEAQLLFNAREWGKAGRAEWLSFYTQHRKYGYHVVLVAQFDRMIDRQIRSLIEYEFIHRKVSNFGIKGLLLSIAMGGHVFVAVKMWYPMKERIGSEFFRAKKRYFAIYDTYMDFG